MKNVIVKLSELRGELKSGVNQMLRESEPELIGFPYQGREAKGFIFQNSDISYLIIDNYRFSSYDTGIEDDGYEVDIDSDEEE